MEKPKIVSVTDALESPDDEHDVPQLPGSVPLNPLSVMPAVPSQFDAFPIKSAQVEEHPEEVPPERLTSVVASVASIPPIPVPQVSAPQSVGVAPSVSESVVDVPQNKPAPAGVPPWVERNPPEPTVAEVAGPIGPVPSYPGVGRPRINSISQSTVSLEPAKPLTAPIRPTAPAPIFHSAVPSVSTRSMVPSAPARPSAPAFLVPASSGKLYERPELDADHFAEDMASHKPASAPSSALSSGVASPLSAAPASKVVQEYRQTAVADLRPPTAPARPRTPEDERAHAKSLAAQIHQDNLKAGFLGQIKRMFGVR
ncbi:hypothetical protein HY994_01210 [Candidatus Micrarchaeota archaeon]|nr:hypothetical protein [Candidatus Micrarchaeota archaeon]